MTGSHAKPPGKSQWKLLLTTLYAELFRTQVFTVAAALAFYFLLAFVPLLLLLSSMLKFLPIPNLIGQLMTLLSRLVPKDAMDLLDQVLNTVLAANGTKLITVGIVGTVWAASGGFSACIDALNIAYDAKDSRPWWRDRLQAVLLTLTSGALAVLSLVGMILGPEFGRVVEHFVGLQLSFARVWPAAQSAITFVSFSIAVMLLYYFAPTVKQRLRSTLPGAVLAVLMFFLGSYALRYYVAHLMNSSKTYGALGAVVALMLWLYLMACAILIGAEANAEYVKLAHVRLDGMRDDPIGPELPPAAEPAPDTAPGIEPQGPTNDCRATLSNDLAAKDGLGSASPTEAAGTAAPIGEMH